MTHSNQSTVSHQSASSVILLDEEQPSRICGCAGVGRYGILFIAVFFFSFLMSSVIAYNATFVSMVDKRSSPLFNGSNLLDPSVDWASQDLSIGNRRYSYGYIEKSLSFSAVYAGAILGTFPINILLSKYGAHKVMFVVGVLATIMVGISPLVIAVSFPLFVVVRFIGGFSMSNIFPVIGIIVNEWASTKEKGLFVAVLSAFVEISALFTMPLSGVIANGLGWPSVFYIHALALGLLTLLWGLYYRDKPNKHPFVETKEWRKISSGKPTNAIKPKTPVSRILHSLSIWAVWIAVLGNFLVSQFSISFSTIYLSYVLDYTPVTSGLIIMIPLGFLLVIKFITGLVSDRISCINELTKVKLFNSLALLGSGIFFILLSAFEPFGHVADLILIATPIALLGFSVGGYPKAAILISKQHSPFVMSIVQIMSMIALAIGSFLVPALTTSDTFVAWRNVFIFYGAILVICNTIFIAFARADPAKWSQTVTPAASQPSNAPAHIIVPDSIA